MVWHYYEIWHKFFPPYFALIFIDFAQNHHRIGLIWSEVPMTNKRAVTNLIAEEQAFIRQLIDD